MEKAGNHAQPGMLDANGTITSANVPRYQRHQQPYLQTWRQITYFSREAIGKSMRGGQEAYHRGRVDGVTDTHIIQYANILFLS